MQAYLDAVLEPWYRRLVSWALRSDHERTKSYAGRLAPEIKLMVEGSDQLKRWASWSACCSAEPAKISRGAADKLDSPAR